MAIRTVSSSPSLKLGLLCLGFGSQEWVEREAGTDSWGFAGQSRVLERPPQAGVQALRASEPSQSALPSRSLLAWRGVGEKWEEDPETPDPPSLTSSPPPPLDTLTRPP